jgi:hypothetical protein
VAGLASYVVVRPTIRPAYTGLLDPHAAALAARIAAELASRADLKILDVLTDGHSQSDLLSAHLAWDFSEFP